MTESEVDVVREEPGKVVARFIGEHDLTTRIATVTSCSNSSQRTIT